MVTVLAGLGLVLGSPAAQAHDQLISSSPQDGEHLASAPTAVRLEFAAEVLTIGAAVVVVDEDGQAWAAGEPTVDGPVVSVPLEPDMPDGAYQIRWRVVSSDGHPISGVVAFTVGDAPASAPAASSQALDDDPAAIEPQAAAPAATNDGAAGTSPWRTGAVGVLGAVVAVGLYAAVLALRARVRGHHSPGPAGAPG
jgi:hypothetical protein